jgi:prophage regulatory protein
MDRNNVDVSTDRTRPISTEKAKDAFAAPIECELINANQFAELLNISERTLYRLKSTDQLPEPIRLGGSVRWRLSEIRGWIDKGCPKKPTTK